MSKKQCEQSPFRDDRESLVAENERLRKELAKYRSNARLQPVVFALVAHIGFRVLFSDWLNGTDDFKVAVAFACLGLPFVVVFIVLFRLFAGSLTQRN